MPMPATDAARDILEEVAGILDTRQWEGWSSVATCSVKETTGYAQSQCVTHLLRKRLFSQGRRSVCHRVIHSNIAKHLCV